MKDETLDALGRVRPARFHVLVSELLPKIRRLSPELSDEALTEAAERMAEYRLTDEELGRSGA
jgi:hypothetical protein